MWGASLYESWSWANSGTVENASIMPVWSDVTMSVSESGTTWKPNSLVEAFGLGIAGRGEELQPPHLVRRAGRFLREGVHPAAVGPVEHLESPGFDTLFERRRDPVAHVVELVVRAEHHRDLQAGDAGVDA